MNLYGTTGFWPRVRARALRAPVFLGALPRQTGRCAPLAYRSFAASYLSPKAFPQARTRSARGEYLSIGLSCTLLSYIASYEATLHLPELRCTLMNNTAPYWATLYPLSYVHLTELHCTLCAILHPSELRCTLLSYAEPYLR
jgi:hypothetical protein